MPRRIQSMGNLCLGGKTRRKNYREEKIWGKDGAKPFQIVHYRAYCTNMYIYCGWWRWAWVLSIGLWLCCAEMLVFPHAEMLPRAVQALMEFYA